MFTYGTNSGNLFDPTVVTSVTHPSQFGNSQANSPQGIPVTAGVEFGWEAFYNFSSETNGPYVFEMTVTTSVDISPTGVITWETRAVSKTTGGLSFSIDVSVRNTTIDLSSVDFVGCTLQNLTDNYIGTPAAARLSSPGTIGIARTLTRYYLSTATPNATYYATWQLSDCPTKVRLEFLQLHWLAHHPSYIRCSDKAGCHTPSGRSTPVVHAALWASLNVHTQLCKRA